MEQIVSFLTNHWILTSVFIALLLALILSELWRSRYAASGLSTQAVIQMINHQGAMVIDLRSEAAFESGHIVAAINIPSSHLTTKFDLLKKYEGKPLILVCTPQQEALRSAEILRQKGIQAVVLEGGLEAWTAAGLPLIKGKTKKA